MERTGLVLVLVVGILSTSAFGFELPGKQLVSKILDKASNLVGKQNQDDFSLRLPQRAIPLGDWDVPFDCPRDGLYGYPDDCTKGVSCFGGKSLAFTCTDLLHFNNFTKQCDDNFCSARCDPSLACECGWDTCETSEFTTEETEIDDELVNNARTSFKCTEDGFYRYPFDCNRYVRCSNGIAYIMACPSGLHFSMKTKRCERPEHAECDSKPSYEEECVSGPVTGPCRGHFQRFYYDVKSRQCLGFVYGGCGGNGNNYKTIEECRNRCEAKTLTSLKMPPSEDYENDEGDVNWPMPFFRSSCSQDGLFAHPDNCYMYYECFRGRRVLHTCRPGLHFNKKAKTCDTPCKAKCDPKLSCARQSTESLTSERSMAESSSSSNLLKSPKNVYKLKVTFVCSEDGLFPHRNDCSKYVNCSNGNAYEMSCPPSRHFNKETQQCEAPCSARCDPDLICDWQDPMIKLEEAYVDICNNTDESYSEKSPYNCEIYYKCEGGVLNKFRCPNGRHFYKKTSRCEEPCKAHCDPRLADKCGWRSVSALDESKELDIAESPLPLKSLESDVTSSSLTTFSQLCTKDGVYLEGNPLDCRTYFKCMDGDADLMYCEEGQHFNQLKLRCEEPCDAHCNFTLVKKCGWRYRSESQNVLSSSLKEPVFDFECPGNGIYANTACENFIQCTGGQAYLINCPYGQHFEPYSRRCTTPCEARCAPNYEEFCKAEEKNSAPKELLGDFDCQTDGYHVNPLDCGSFIQCFKGDAYVIPCPPDLHYSPTLEICMSPCEAKCAPNYDEFCRADELNRRYLQRSQSFPAKQPFPLVSQFICSHDGVYPNPEDCSSYIECVMGESFEKDCPDGLHFSEETQTCEPPCDARCDSSLGQSCGWNDIWAAAEGTRKADFDYKMFSDANSPRLMYHFTCMKDGLYKNPENCSSYIQCYGGHSYVMPCPPGLHFNAHIKACDYPCSAHCDKDLACECGWDTCGDACEKNEEFLECGTACPPTCDDKKPGFCDKKCVRGCFCKPGYIREWAGGKCIPDTKCPSDTCGDNEEFLKCGTACPPTCDDRKPEICTEQCVIGCFCKKGFIRDNVSGKCVRESECPSETCGPNEVYTECVNPCNSCDLMNVTCNFLICNEGCDCRDGYTRNEQRICIPVNECPPVDCEAPMDRGPCNDNYIRYTYDTQHKRCIHFIYGGCGGNTNRFKTLLECEDTCLRKPLRSEEVDCEAEPETGPCKASIPRYYYDSMSGRCRGFIYGGCRGNSNNFRTMDECENKCRSKHLGGFRCPEENGMFGHYPDCMSYYHCKRGIPTLKRCPSGTAFDHKKSKCVTEYEASCVYECRDNDAVYPYEKDCRKYIDCVNGISKLETCPPGKAFDPEERDCIDEKKVETCFWE